MKNTLLVLLFLFVAGGQAQAHGEDKPGPHGGYIRMPGPFHTEVVPVGKHSFTLYLLDIHWKNPTVKNSSVSARIEPQAGKLKCVVKENFYHCEAGASVDLKKKGALVLNVTRDGQKGMTVRYPLPLTWDAGGHGGH